MPFMFHEGETTEELSDRYGHWLRSQPPADRFEDEPADELLMFDMNLTPAQRDWLTDFCAAYREAEEREDATRRLPHYE